MIKLLLSIRTVAYVPPPVSEHPNQYSFHLVHSQTQSIASYGAKTSLAGQTPSGPRVSGNETTKTEAISTFVGLHTWL